MKLKTNLLIAGACCGLLVAANSVAANADFNVNLQLRQDLSVVKTADLEFPDQLAGVANAVTLTPEDTGHAAFEATGTAGEEAVGTFSNDTTTLSCLAGQGACTAVSPNVVVSGFTCGGTEKVAASVCDYQFNTDQKANIQVGATETTVANNVEGNYTGSNTFNIVYK